MYVYSGETIKYYVKINPFLDFLSHGKQQIREQRILNANITYKCHD